MLNILRTSYGHLTDTFNTFYNISLWGSLQSGQAMSACGRPRQGPTPPAASQPPPHKAPARCFVTVLYRRHRDGLQLPRDSERKAGRDRRTASAAESGWTADLLIEKSLESSAYSHFNRTGRRCNWNIRPQQAGPTGPATRPSDRPHELAWSGVTVPGTGLCAVWAASLRATTDGPRPLAAPDDAAAARRGRLNSRAMRRPSFR